MAVGRAAQRVLIEVRNQFRGHPGIMNFTEKPEYGRVVDICTRDSLRELVTPGLLAVLTPIAAGFALGTSARLLPGRRDRRHACWWRYSWPTPAAPGVGGLGVDPPLTLVDRASRATPKPKPSRTSGAFVR